MATESKYALYLRDLGAVLKDRALEARSKRDDEQSDFQKGRLIAYYEVLSTMRGQASTFGLSTKDLSLDGIDLEVDLLPSS